MSDIRVWKQNESTVYVVAKEESTQRELYDYFTFEEPGAKYSEAFKKRHWDGKTHLLHKRFHTLPSGLVLYVAAFAKDNNYTVDIDPKLEVMNNFSLHEAMQFTSRVLEGTRLKARDYQILGFAKAIRYKKVVLVSPTASGKSLMMYLITRYLLNKECRRGLIIVPNINLVEQLYSDFKSYGWDVENSCQKIYQGHSRQLSKSLVISTWQSIFDMEDPEFFKEFDFVIGDEAHGFKASSLKSIMSQMTEARYRIGTTGTMDDFKIHRLKIEGHFGPVSHITTTKELMEQGHLAPLKIKAIILGHPDHARDVLRKVPEYSIEMDYLARCVKRNEFIKNLALSLNGNSLVLVQFIEKHGDALYAMIAKQVAAGRQVFYVHGGTEGEQRESIRRIVETEKDAIIVASYGVYSTGVNIKNLHNIIFASPSKSKIRVLQSIGRGLRLGDNKSGATLYDISDDFRKAKYTNHTLKHYLERLKIYEKEGFKVSKYLVDLKYDGLTPTS